MVSLLCDLKHKIPVVYKGIILQNRSMLILYNDFVVCQPFVATILLCRVIFMKNAQKTYEIFAKLLEERGVTPYRIYKETGVPQSSLSEWKRGNSMPKIDKMIKIADYFGVSVDYLLGNEQKEKPITDESNELDNIYLDLAKDAQKNKIDPEDIKAAIDMIKLLRNKQ